MSKINTFTLSNGLEVVLLHDPSLPIISSQLCYQASPCLEEHDECGISHFLEHMMFKGSRRFPRGSIDALTLDFGGNNNACTWIDGTMYSFNLPAEHWPVALEIEADRMQQALLDPEEIEAEREVILEEWRSSQDDPEERLWETMGQRALPHKHPYAKPVLGQQEDIQRFQRLHLERYYRRHYHPNHATLVAVGDLPENAQTLLENTLGQIPQGPQAPPVQDLPAITSRHGSPRFTLELPDVQIPRLLMTWPAPAITHPDYPGFLLLHYALTEGWSSLLYHKLIEEDKIASDVSSLLFETRHPYLFWIQAEANDSSLETLEQAIHHIIAEISTSGLEPALFERAKQQLLTDFYLQRETCEDQAEFLGELLLAGHAPDLGLYAERLKAIQPKDVQRVLRSYLTNEHCYIGYLHNTEQEEYPVEPSPEPQRPARNQSNTPLKPPTQNKDFYSLVLPSRQLKLANGMQFVSHEHNKTPTLSLALHLPAGCLYHSSEQAGLASLCLSSVIKGPHHQPDQLTQAFESKGASLSLSCGLLTSVLRVETLVEHSCEMLDLLKQTVSQALLDPEEVRKEQNLSLSSLKQAQESPSWQAGYAFARQIYANSILAHPADGNIDSLSKLQPEQVRHFYQQHYNPQGSMLFASGPEASIRQLEKSMDCFLTWQSKELQALHSLPNLQRQSHRYYAHLSLPEREQSTLLFGHLGVPREHPDYQALLLLDIVLGSGPGFSSRIPQRLREREGLAYHVSFSATSSASTYPGMVQAQVDCSPDKILHCVQGIREEIQRVQNEAISQNELQRAQNYLCGHFPFFFETNRQRCSYFWQKQAYQWPENYPQIWLEEIQALSPADLQRAAQRHLDTDAFTLITAGANPGWKAEQVYAL